MTTTWRRHKGASEFMKTLDVVHLSGRFSYALLQIQSLLRCRNDKLQQLTDPLSPRQKNLIMVLNASGSSPVATKYLKNTASLLIPASRHWVFI